MSDFEDKVREILQKCRQSGDLVEVYDDEEDLARFDVGVVESVTRDAYCIQSIGPYGDFDGRQVGRIEEIVRISTGSEYLAALRLLHEARDKISAEPPSTDGYTPLDIHNSLRFAKDHHIMISIVDPQHESITGFVNDFGTDYVELIEVRRDGMADGTIVIHLEDVVRIDLGGRTEQARAFVHHVRMGL